ncbi:MAG: hypothetical protein KGI89_11375, partial [Euryarchaeota archaeon]|nr:hypothetical protein [Euryarchaeota archaeon]
MGSVDGLLPSLLVLALVFVGAAATFGVATVGSSRGLPGPFPHLTRAPLYLPALASLPPGRGPSPAGAPGSEAAAGTAKAPDPVAAGPCPTPPFVQRVIPVGLDPVGVAYDAGKGEVFVANPSSDNLTVISAVTDQVVTSVPEGGGNPWGIAYDGAKGELFVSNYNGNSVSVVSDSSNSVVATIPVGSTPDGIAYDPAKGEVFGANAKCGVGCGASTLSVISDA